jgi:DNA-binding NarL/FixJ family response regulator
VRCLIVDNSWCFVEAAQPVLEHGGITVVGAAFTVDEALRRVDELRPDVILLNIGVGDEMGFEVASRLADRAEQAPSDFRCPKIVLTSAYPRNDYKDLIEDLIEANQVVGYVAKAALSARAVHDLLRGDGISIDSRSR